MKTEASTTFSPYDYGYIRPAPAVSVKKPPRIGESAKEFFGSIAFLTMMFLAIRLIITVM